MPYNHAGEIGDIWKHLPICDILTIEKPRRYIETNSAFPFYILPQKSQLDALHLALAIEYKIDYLLTWNCSHLANGFIINKLKEFELSSSMSVPIIVTPEELTSGGGDYDMG